MKIAVVGSGISGLASAWRLSEAGHEVTLFEASDRLGGHTHTHRVELNGRRLAVDTGFIVFNPLNYPLLTAMFDELGVASQPTTMSFSVHNAASGLEYNAGTLNGLFCQRRNLVSPRFIGMVRDLLRFYRESPELLRADAPACTLAEYLGARGYGAAFRDDHLVPMASALWSSPPEAILAFPMRLLVRFMANHQMLQTDARPQWRVVTGGSSRYIDALCARWTVRVRLSSPVERVLRNEAGVRVHAGGASERFDHVVLACHSDQALALLADGASAQERDILGAIEYQPNDVVLHTDASLLPRKRAAWAAWNAHVPRDAGAPCTVSYHMNQLQGLDSPEPVIVTLNRSEAIASHKVLARMRYHHPLYSLRMEAAQARRDEIQGHKRTWFAGAYWGYGFHEDGMRSAAEVCRGLLERMQPLALAA